MKSLTPSEQHTQRRTEQRQKPRIDLAAQTAQRADQQEQGQRLAADIATLLEASEEARLRSDLRRAEQQERHQADIAGQWQANQEIQRRISDILWSEQQTQRQAEVISKWQANQDARREADLGRSEQHEQRQAELSALLHGYQVAQGRSDLVHRFEQYGGQHQAELTTMILQEEARTDSDSELSSEQQQQSEIQELLQARHVEFSADATAMLQSEPRSPSALQPPGHYHEETQLRQHGRRFSQQQDEEEDQSIFDDVALTLRTTEDNDRAFRCSSSIHSCEVAPNGSSECLIVSAEEMIVQLPVTTITNAQTLPENCQYCSICLESYDTTNTGNKDDSKRKKIENKNSRRMILPCFHGFHEHCAKRWLLTSHDGACPICKCQV